MSRPGAAHLAEQIRTSQELLARIDGADGPARLAELQHWQRCRLRETYADLGAQPRYRAACVFFLEELYGGRDMRERDRQLERALPIMRRTLPDHLLEAVGEAMRLQWISMDFDARLAGCLEGPLDQREYARAYRRLADWEGRREQIELIDALGHLLMRTVKVPVIRRLVRWMRRPAHAVGVGQLQEFLENGLDAFSEMGSAAETFVRTIVERETRALEQMQAGHDWPFAEWIGAGPEAAGPGGDSAVGNS